jgi:hypothetical protein
MMVTCRCYIDALYLEADSDIITQTVIVFCPLHAAAPDLLAALKRFVHPNNRWNGVYHLPQFNRAPVLACRHCNGYGTNDSEREIDQFIHDDDCAILEARRAIIAATSVPQGAQLSPPQREE